MPFFKPDYEMANIFTSADSEMFVSEAIDDEYNKGVQTDYEPLLMFWEGLKDKLLEESQCSICLENFTLHEDHRVVSLKCGHIFGESCIRRWMTEIKMEGGPKCPTCKTKTKAADVRYIEVKSFKKTDPEVVSKYTSEAAEFRAKRMQIESESEAYRERIQLLKYEHDKIKALFDAEEKEYAKLVASENELIAGASARNLKQMKLQPLVLTHRLELKEGSEARVVTVSDMYGVCVIAQKNTGTLFSPYGLRNIGTASLTRNEFIPLHQSIIKDAAFHPWDALVLTASLDKTVKITNIHNSRTVTNIPVEVGVWSCCWNEKNPNYLYAGLKDGTVREYDMRMTSNAVSRIAGNRDFTPVCSLKYINSDYFPGLVSTRLRSSSFHFKRGDTFVTQSLPVHGHFISSHFDHKTESLLFSSRPNLNKNQPNIAHSVYKLSLNTIQESWDERLIDCLEYKTFYGGHRADQILKGRIFPHPNKNNHSLICAGDQDIGGLIVWDTESNEAVQKIGGITPAFDIAQVVDSPNIGFIALTDKSLNYYKWRL